MEVLESIDPYGSNNMELEDEGEKRVIQPEKCAPSAEKKSFDAVYLNSDLIKANEKELFDKMCFWRLLLNEILPEIRRSHK